MRHEKSKEMESKNETLRATISQLLLTCSICFQINHDRTFSSANRGDTTDTRYEHGVFDNGDIT